MKRSILLGMTSLAAFGFAALGCGDSNNSSGTTGSGGNGGNTSASGSGGSSTGGSSGTGGSSASSGGSSGSSGGTSGSSGGSSGSSGGTSGSSGGTSGTTAACGTTAGTYQETTTFATAGSTTPYKLNKWGTWGDSTAPTLAQTTTGPTGLDCSAGCAALTIDFSNGTAQYSAGQIVEYFGTSSDAVTNLLNETITVKLAVAVTQATGATVAVPISINLFGEDTYTSTTGVDNLWTDDLGSTTALAASSGWHTATFKVVDAKVPSWSPTRTVCASALHAIGITIQNNSVIDATNAATVTLYIQSVGIGA